ncbi:phage baseplate assembly protein V [Nocardioides sp.]|uniref:phage baseplate assembly protein V n=1 Tax=Nocardioides sp. TaxID=35761 RepID=UPI003562D7FD
MAHFGKYRGLVVGTADPDQLGRLQVSCPSVLGDIYVWAMPCLPYGAYARGRPPAPPPGTTVWVEFEEGDVERPIVAGYFWVTPVE